VDNVGHKGKFSKDNTRNKWTNDAIMLITLLAVIIQAAVQGK
jgi:hypothetical protein